MNETKTIIETIVAELQNAKNEKEIRSITINGWKQLQELVPNKNTFNRECRTPLRKAIEEAFPTKLDSDKKPKGYYFTKAGKGKGPRYEHLALWYATTSEDRWELVGDKARQRYWENLPQLPEADEQKEVTDTIPAQNTEKEVIKEDSATKRLESMIIEDLELDKETEEVVTSALSLSGMPLAEFIQQACRVYAKTITGKAKKSSADLSSIPTEELRKDKAYKTHPGRAEELIQRAIKAIEIHNGNATEVQQKWFITQSLLLSMTGSKVQTIQEFIGKKDQHSSGNPAKFQLTVEDINARLVNDYNATEYINRKSEEEKTRFTEETWMQLVPFGVD